MTTDPSDNTPRQTGGVSIGNVYGGIRDTIIAGRDVIIEKYFGSPKAQRDYRNRQNMLQLVWNTWIEGVLKQSLHNEVLIELGMETRPDAVEHPWDMVVQMPDREPLPVAPGITMLELFDQTNGSLLILGDPGSGKTTMLLELCRQEIIRAKEDPLQPIPVILNLSSWKPESRKKPEGAFADWLLSELRDRYSVPNKISRPWIENDALLLLLDGLDEVRERSREACVQSINAFRVEHNIALAICSRSREYEDLTPKLGLLGAVTIQPLTKQQVDGYLQAAGAGSTSVHQVMQRDPEMREFTQTPLILSILVLVFLNASDETTEAQRGSGDFRKRLFNAYITQMFNRRGVDQHYSPKESQIWLTWLAREMLKRRQSEFNIEDIQPSWLPSPNRKRGLIFRLLFGPKSRLIVGVIAGLIVLLFLGPLAGLIYGVGIGRIAGPKDIKPTDKLTWSRRRFRNRMIIGLIVGLIAGLIVGFLYGLMFRLPVVGLIVGLIFGISIGLLVLLISFLRSESIKERSSPGDGITASRKSFLIAVLFYGLSSGLLIWLVNTPFYMAEYGVFNGLIAGLFFGPLGGLFIGLGIGLNYGAGFLVRHYISRWLIYRSGNIPWTPVDFLDYCQERIFLRRVGGGYIFIHRMLMEHFAEMYQETANQI